MNQSILLQHPYHPYAVRFMELLRHKYGLRSICFYTDVHQRLREAPRYPLLRSEIVDAAYDVREDRLAEFASHLKKHHNIAAVIPFAEPAVLNAVELARRLDLTWAQPDVMRRFRDKFALKDYLRTQHPELRMTASRRVYTVADIKDMISAATFKKFVLKPNDGYGNRGIGIFDINADDRRLNEYLRAQHGDTVVMEEYVDGIEYFVNGQADAHGNVMVVAVFEYQRVAANQRDNIDYETRRVASTDPRFPMLSQYAIQIMQATGLKRSPFHMEIKVDERGPCLIEVAARLVGLGNAELCGKMHGDLDLFDLAAHYYLSDRDYGPVLLNWDRYNAFDVRYVHGIADHNERIYSLGGVQAIEAMPEFVQWVSKPEVGATMNQTVDCLTMPWSAIIQAPNAEMAAAVATRLRDTLRWNTRVSNFKKIMVNSRALSRRYFTAGRVRLMGALLKSQDSYRRVELKLSFIYLFKMLLNQLRQTFETAGYRLQMSGWRSPFAPPLDRNYEDPSRAAKIIAWAESYLAKPHPLLGRKGAVCPFVQHTINRGGFIVSFHDNVDGSGLLRMRRAILDEATRFQKRFPRDIRKGLFSSVVIVFPNLTGEREALVERMHDELKTHFAISELMCTPFHSNCSKPSITNAEFEAFRAPFAGFVVRHMDVRDIIFLDHNHDAFMRYRERFAELFERGEVDNEYGYVDRYVQACRRFG